jgi:hypothetical protein
MTGPSTSGRVVDSIQAARVDDAVRQVRLMVSEGWAAHEAVAEATWLVQCFLRQAVERVKNELRPGFGDDVPGPMPWGERS